MNQYHHAMNIIITIDNIIYIFKGFCQNECNFRGSLIKCDNGLGGSQNVHKYKLYGCPPPHTVADTTTRCLQDVFIR